MTDEELEQLRRSLVMAPNDAPATALTNNVAADLIGELQQARKALEATQLPPNNH